MLGLKGHYSYSPFGDGNFQGPSLYVFFFGGSLGIRPLLQKSCFRHLLNQRIQLFWYILADDKEDQGAI